MNVQQKIAFGFIRAKLNSLALLNRRKAGEVAFRLFCTPLTRSKKKSDLFSGGEKLTVQFNDLNIRGTRFNHPQNKKVLILHGFSSSSHNFDKFIPLLFGENFEVIAFDAPAHGESEGDTVNALEYAQLIEKLNKEIGPFNGFIAHSFGGLAVSLALENIPHDPGTRVALIAPATETTTAISVAFGMLGLKNPNIRKALEDHIHMASGKQASWFSVRRAMQNVKASVLWIHDEDDDTTPVSDAKNVESDHHPHIHFHFTKGLGHSRIYRDEKVRHRVVNFISGR